MSRIAGLVCLLCLIVFVVGCGQKSSGSTGTASLKKLGIETITPGTGDQVAADGDRLYIKYEGKLTDGTVFDGNVEKTSEPPYAVVLGKGQVIKGWDQGLLGMKVGEKRKLSIPSNLAYGPQGKDKILPDSDLYFEVELLYLVKAGEEGVYLAEELTPGTGPEAKEGDTVEIHYTGKYLNGAVFDDSRKRERTFTFKIGEKSKDRAIPGIDDGVKTMKVGGKRKLTIPPSLIMGDFGGPSLKGNQVCVFEVELISVNGKKA